MFKTLSRLISAVLLISLFSYQWAEADVLPYTLDDPQMLQPQTKVKSGVRVKADNRAEIEESAYHATKGALHFTEEAIAARSEAKSAVAQYRRKASTRTTVPELDGTWILSYKPAMTTSAASGCSVNIQAVDGSDTQVTIENFWRKGTKLTGEVDRKAGTLKIPYQYITTHTSYGNINVGRVNPSNGAAIRTDSIRFYLQDDGTLLSTDWWAMFVASGDYAGEPIDAWYKTIIQKGNATMSHTVSDESETYPVIATQVGTNLLEVFNFRNLGQTIEVLLNRDKTATINKQAAYFTTASSYYTTAGNVVLDDNGYPVSWDDVITIPASTDLRTLKWTDWSLFNGKIYWTGFTTDTHVDLPFDLSYPDPYSSTEFKGSGTEFDPWIISSADDFMVLADKVNSITPTVLTADTTLIAPAYRGKYFRLDADIDFAGARITPVGNDGIHHFAATFDGNGHKVKNMSISTGSVPYAALFGVVDTLGVVKNLTVENISVSTTSNCPAAIASRSYGVIDNCHVYNAYIYSSLQGGAGIASIATTIKNCTVNNSTINALEGYQGGIASQVLGSIENCGVVNTNLIFDLELTQGTPTGGIAAYVSGRSIKNCYFQGKINGSTSSYYARIGGIVGYAVTATLENCYASVVIVPGSSTTEICGGLIGSAYAAVSNCYATGYVDCSQSKYVGGLVGMNMYAADSQGGIHVGAFVNCYSNMKVYASIPDTYDASVEMRETLGAFDTSNPPTHKNVYYNKQITNFGSRGGLSVAQLTSAAGPDGFSSNNWVFTEGAYPRLKGMDDTEVAMMSASALQLSEKSSYDRVVADAGVKTLGNTKLQFCVNGKNVNDGRFAKISDSKMVLNSDLAFGTDSLVVVNGDMSLVIPLTVLPMPFEGDGTAASPYLIKSKDDLVALSSMTTKWQLSYSDMVFRMTNDIDLEYTDKFEGLGNCGGSNTSITFNSVFDGGGYSIHNLKLGKWSITTGTDGKDVVDTDSATWIGFVGRLGSTGVVRNLTIAADCKYNVFASAGAIAGWNYGLIENCHNYADIAGYSSWIGGIAGQVLKTGIVRNCTNAGNISTGYRNVGGITSNVAGLVENCVNTGTIAATTGYQPGGKNNIMYAGGIAGATNGGMIKNCVNAGNVSALEGTVGGIVGSLPKTTSVTNYSNDIVSNVSYGVVSTPVSSTAGGVAGISTTEGTVQYNYWDSQLMTFGAVANADKDGANATTTATLTSGKALAGLSTDIWDFTEGEYPTLKAVASMEHVRNARRIVVNIPENSNAMKLDADATLSSADGLSWKLLGGKNYTIEGNTLKVPTTITSILSDTLVAQYGIVSKQFPLRSIPQLYLTGAGTSENPYLITSATDWNALSDYMITTDIDFEGEYFKITNDIDFTNVEFKPLGISPTYFDATLDGNGATVKGYSYAPSDASTGVFGVIGENGVVKNLTVSGEIISSYTKNNYTYLGGFVGEMRGTLKDCVNLSKVKSGKGYVAGFAGKAIAGARFENCVNRGDVEGCGYLAGIAAESAAGVYFERCGNEGKIIDNGKTTTTANYVGGIVASSKEASYVQCYNKCKFELASPTTTNYVGGIVAYCGGTKGGATYIFKNCYNESDIEAGGTVGGITAATISTVGAAPMEITECYNTGNLHTLNSGSYYVAGISTHYKPGSIYSDCYNTGNITSDKHAGVAGIAAVTSGTPTDEYQVLFIGCHNEGKLTANGGDCGGVVNNLATYATVQECYNTGEIVGKHGLGGVVGILSGATAKVVDSWNVGTITANNNRTGGIVGYHNSNAGTSTAISNCWNSGAISSTGIIGGTATTGTSASAFAIGGIAGQTNAIITNCVNYGTVKGLSQVGGIVGAPIKAKTKVVNCINVGSLDAPVDTCGNLIGANTENGRLWADGNEVTGSYYATDFGTYTNDRLGSGVALSQITTLDMGKDWIAGDNYTVPIYGSHEDNDAAAVAAAMIVPAEGDTYAAITKPFNVGAPEGLSWVASDANVVIKGTNVTFANDVNADVVLTATCGNYTKSVTVKVNAPASGIDEILADKNVVSAVYYTLAGVKVGQPESHDGAVYLVTLTYADGTKKTVKLFNK